MFEVGRQARCTGIYFLHWEWSRFEVREPRRLLGSRVYRCQLIDGDQLPGGPMEVLGGRLPDDWRHHRALAFDVTADVTPVEQGSFGHLGTLKWRLRVDRWVHVKPLGQRALN